MGGGMSLTVNVTITNSTKSEIQNISIRHEAGRDRTWGSVPVLHPGAASSKDLMTAVFPTGGATSQWELTWTNADGKACGTDPKDAFAKGHKLVEKDKDAAITLSIKEDGTINVESRAGSSTLPWSAVE